MDIDKKILEELKRYNKINRYIAEQDLPPGEEGGDLPPSDAALPATDAGSDTTAVTPPPPAEPVAVDTTTDPEVEKLDNQGNTTEGGETDSEELDITDLVNSQKNIETKQEEYFQNLFSHLETLEGKLAEMDKIVNQLNSLESKVENMRPKTAQEKLELRSLDSFPFNQKLTDFFEDKQDDMIASGKNEYVLTTDDVEDISPKEVKRTFTDYDQETLTPKF